VSGLRATACTNVESVTSQPPGVKAAARSVGKLIRFDHAALAAKQGDWLMTDSMLVARDCTALALKHAGPPAVLTVAIPLHLSSVDLPTCVHKAMTRCTHTCSRRAYMSARLVKHVPVVAVQMIGLTGASRVHVRFATVVAVSACPAASITSQSASFAYVHVRTCMPDEPCAVPARRHPSMPEDARMLITAAATATAAATGSK